MVPIGANDPVTPLTTGARWMMNSDAALDEEAAASFHVTSTLPGFPASFAAARVDGMDGAPGSEALGVPVTTSSRYQVLLLLAMNFTARTLETIAPAALLTTAIWAEPRS